MGDEERRVETHATVLACSASLCKRRRRRWPEGYTPARLTLWLWKFVCVLEEGGWNCPWVVFSSIPADTSAPTTYYTVFFPMMSRAKDINVNNREKMNMIFNKYLIHFLPLVLPHMVSQGSVSLNIQHPLQWYRKTSERFRVLSYFN